VVGWDGDKGELGFAALRPAAEPVESIAVLPIPYSAPDGDAAARTGMPCPRGAASGPGWFGLQLSSLTGAWL